MFKKILYKYLKLDPPGAKESKEVKEYKELESIPKVTVIGKVALHIFFIPTLIATLSLVVNGIYQFMENENTANLLVGRFLTLMLVCFLYGFFLARNHYVKKIKSVSFISRAINQAKFLTIEEMNEELDAYYKNNPDTKIHVSGQTRNNEFLKNEVQK